MKKNKLDLTGKKLRWISAAILKTLMILIYFTFLFGCIVPHYHYIKKVTVIVNFADHKRINEEYQKTRNQKKVYGFAFPHRVLCEIWVEKGDTEILGHEFEHCLNERPDDM